VTPALSRAWFDRPATEVAPDLLGRHLVRRSDDGTVCRVRLVETEAYEPEDPASHSFRGLTARTRTMFGPPAHL
jgi:DNA-3-methyladenine glycosylase